MKSILKYPGAKNKVAGWIVANMPLHKVYLEPYFGSGSVFLNKPKVHIETINDIDGQVVNYFRVIRDNPAALQDAIRLTPYSRAEYDNSFLISETDSDVEQARKFAVRCFMGFGSSLCYKNGFRSSKSATSPSTTKEWKNIPFRMAECHERLLDAQIEQRPALELISSYDTKDAFIYLDPPYLLDTRKGYLYKTEMSEMDHIALLELITTLKYSKVMISGYDNALYNSYLSGWTKKQHTAQAERGYTRTETIWMNYENHHQMSFLE